MIMHAARLNSKDALLLDDIQAAVVELEKLLNGRHEVNTRAWAYAMRTFGEYLKEVKKWPGP
jgi:hypothetical protein